MILTTHALTGAVIGKNINNIPLIIILSLIIHFSMDSIRHAEYFDARTAKIKNTWWKIAIDLLTGTITVALLILWKKIDTVTTINTATGIFFSLLPDGITLLHYLSGQKYFIKPKEFHGWAHRYSKIPKYAPERQWSLKNARNDIIISIIAIILLLLS